MINATTQQHSAPLADLKVIDLSHVMAGPTCSLLLADMGAGVIKVEKIPGGDDTRHSIPPAIAGESAAFLMMNRNKRGIALDLKTEAGRKVLSRLLHDADVLIENYRPGAMERMGFGYDALHRANPRLIYCSITGFGRTGPYADRGGFDLIAQGMSGLMSITGEGPGCPPMKVGAPITDITAGILACVGILAALHSRASTGQGQMVDTSLFEAGIIHTYWQSAICFATGQPPGPMGSRHPLNAPYQAFPTADGWVTVGAANQANWLRLVAALEAPELGDDSRFAANADRMHHTYWQSAICFATGQPPGPMGSRHPLNAPYQAFPTADGWVTVGAANQANWLRLVAALEAPELGDDSRFAANADRMHHLPALEAALTPLFQRRTSAEWLERLAAAGVPAGPVLDVAQMHADPQVLARGMVVETAHPVAGPVKAIGLPIKFSAFSATPGPAGRGRAAPLFGQHTAEVLREHGFSGAEITQMSALGAVHISEPTKAVAP